MSEETIVSVRTFLRKPSEMHAEHPEERAPIIEGLLREGETINIVAAPKMGKSWLALQLAYCLALGKTWLGRRCAGKKVLYFDNELHEETLSSRMEKVEGQLGIFPEEADDFLQVGTLRGNLRGIDSLLADCAQWVKADGYGVIVVDALYRALPNGCEENSNTDMRQVYNLIDRFAELTGVAVILVHHTSKGDQREKRVTDVGSGAGTFSRATDTHLVILPHSKEKGVAMMLAETRSFPSPGPVRLRRTDCLWEVAPEAEAGAEEAKASVSPSQVVAEVLRGLGGSVGKTALREKVREFRKCSTETALALVERARREGAIVIRKAESGGVRELCTLPGRAA